MRRRTAQGYLSLLWAIFSRVLGDGRWQNLLKPAVRTFKVAPPTPWSNGRPFLRGIGPTQAGVDLLTVALRPILIAGENLLAVLDIAAMLGRLHGVGVFRLILPRAVSPKLGIRQLGRGVLSVKDANGEEVAYATPGAMQRAISALESRIAAMQTPAPNTIKFKVSKGL